MMCGRKQVGRGEIPEPLLRTFFILFLFIFKTGVWPKAFSTRRFEIIAKSIFPAGSPRKETKELFQIQQGGGALYRYVIVDFLNYETNFALSNKC